MYVPNRIEFVGENDTNSIVRVLCQCPQPAVVVASSWSDPVPRPRCYAHAAQTGILEVPKWTAPLATITEAYECPRCNTLVDRSDIEERTAYQCSNCDEMISEGRWEDADYIECPSCNETIRRCPECDEWAEFNETDTWGCHNCEEDSPEDQWEKTANGLQCNCGFIFNADEEWSPQQDRYVHSAIVECAMCGDKLRNPLALSLRSV